MANRIPHIPSGPPFTFFSPSSSLLAGRALRPAAVITKNSLVSSEWEGTPLTCRVPEAWQVAFGVYGPTKPERPDSPLPSAGPVPAQISASPCTALLVPQYPHDSSGRVHPVGGLGPHAQ